MNIAEIVGILVLGAGGYLWFVRGQVLLGLIVAILGALLFVGSLHISGSI